MPHLDGTGPEGKGKQTGRKLGKCDTNPQNKSQSEFGVGMGKKRKADGGTGNKKRLKSGNI
jgi:hypothetical protein